MNDEGLVTIEWDDWDELVNETFVPLVDNRDRYLILWGSRGSSKSDFAAKKLIYRCLEEKYFRYVLVRNTYGTIEDSSYQTIKDIIHDLGLESLFEFKKQPLRIDCYNGNSFLARGCDDTTKLKSIKDPTGVWYEEDIVSEADFITITTGVRTTKADYLQEIFSINPEVDGNYEENWFWKRFFKGQDNRSFSSVTKMKIDEKTEVDLTYTVHHSTYKDNKYIPPQFIAFLLDLKEKNPYYYTIYALGEWGNKQLGGLFYKNFNIGRNTFNFEYKPDIALHLSFDFNVNPYMSATLWQIVGNAVYLIDEFAMKTPFNTTKGVCKAFKEKYFRHGGGLFIYGDPSGKQQDTRGEKGYNDYRIIANELESFKPVERVASAHPPVVMRGMFINDIFLNQFDNISINLFENSVYLKNDLLFGKEASDGTKLKEKVKENEVTYEKYHHHSDSMDYFICKAFEGSFAKFQHGEGSLFNRQMGRSPINEQKKY